MSKKPARTWTLMVSLGAPLVVVGVAAMLITFATLIDVAKLAGLPFPAAFPIVVDVGMIGLMIAVAQLRIRGLDGRWIAYVAFVGLAAMSVVANATHSSGTADLLRMPLWAAAVIGAVPPATLLVMTHLVMHLIPDEKERAKLQKDRVATEAFQQRNMRVAVPVVHPPLQSPAPMATVAATAAPTTHAEPAGLRLVDVVATPEKVDKGFVSQQVLEFVAVEGRRPTGAQVGEWLGGKTSKTGQRHLLQMEADGLFDEVAAVVTG